MGKYQMQKHLIGMNTAAIEEYLKSISGTAPKKRNRERELKRYAEQKAKLAEGRKRELYMLICDVEAAVCDAVKSPKFGDLPYTKLRNRLKKFLEILGDTK